MNKREIIQQTESFIVSEFQLEGSGHDWFHIDRVRKMALRIGFSNGCDLFVTEMAALLHDLDDWKLVGSDSHFPSGAEKWLNEMGVEPELASQILRVIEDVSFLGAGTETPVRSVEAAVVQDADRLDAMGALGIARTFSYGGHKNRLIYDPAVLPVMHPDFQEYKKSLSPTINHFYEKLLLLKDRMNTETARIIAEERHQFMEDYLVRFFEEWEATR
ncbi:MAG TPA: HD domain-containing protein [Prolixibacteraceae bacterium]|nr:HD domain-containing protein [Prolixibacteraceae bacterium]